MNSRYCFAAFVALASFAAAPLSAQPLTSAITYQGQLKQSGAPLNNTADFEFRLFNALSGGAQVGSTNLVNNVNVVDGVFTATLDFGSSSFSGDQRWLQIAVRSPAGAGNFTTLTPRQPLTAAPFALYALTGPGSGGPWAVSGNNVFNTNTGNVGIGTSAPQANLHLLTAGEGVRIQGPSGGVTNQAWLSFTNSAGTRMGYVGDGSGGDNAVFLTADSGDVVLNTLAGRSLVVSASGNVGIGTSTPLSRLDVRGDIRLGNSGQFRAAAGEENLRIIRGTIDGSNATATIIAGSGFTCQRLNQGVYRISFTTPFAGLPSLTVTPFLTGDPGDFEKRWPLLDAVNSSQAQVFFLCDCFDQLIDSTFSFCAIGPR